MVSHETKQIHIDRLSYICNSRDIFPSRYSCIIYDIMKFCNRYAGNAPNLKKSFDSSFHRNTLHNGRWSIITSNEASYLKVTLNIYILEF